MGVGEINWVIIGIKLDIAFLILNFSKYISNLLFRYFQIFKQIYRYFLGIRLNFQYLEISDINIV